MNAVGIHEFEPPPEGLSENFWQSVYVPHHQIVGEGELLGQGLQRQVNVIPNLDVVERMFLGSIKNEEDDKHSFLLGGPHSGLEFVGPSMGLPVTDDYQNLSSVRVSDSPSSGLTEHCHA